MDFLKHFVDFETEGQVNPYPPTKPLKPVGLPTRISSPDEQMVESLLKVMMKRKTPYTALLDTSKKMEAAIPDENSRIKAAFAILSSDGTTTDNIAQSIDVHLTDLEGEHLRFKSISDQQVQQQSKSIKDRINNLTQENTSATTQIEELRLRIAALEEKEQKNNSEIITLTSQANELDLKITSTYNSFKNALDHIKNDLNNKKLTLGRILA
jgi:chromosome segregation ATPase